MRQRKTGQTEPEPICPSWLNGVSQAKWKELVPMLERMGVLRSADALALAVYCRAWATFVECSKRLDDEGLVVDGRRGGRVKNPLVAILNSASDTLLKIAGDFGMTPKSRARLGIPSRNTIDDSLEDFMNSAPKLKLRTARTTNPKKGA